MGQRKSWITLLWWTRIFVHLERARESWDARWSVECCPASISSRGHDARFLEDVLGEKSSWMDSISVLCLGNCSVFKWPIRLWRIRPERLRWSRMECDGNPWHGMERTPDIRKEWVIFFPNRYLWRQKSFLLSILTHLSSFKFATWIMLGASASSK